MKTFKRVKLNSKGFSHVELVLVIVALVAIVAVGFAVYKHGHKTNVAHAGGWTYLGTGIIYGKSITYKGYACLDNAGAYGTYIKGMIITPVAVPQSTYARIIDLNASKEVLWYSTPDTGWLYGTTNITPLHLVNLNVTNYVTVVAYGPSGGIGTSAQNAPRAGSLAAC